MKLNNIEVIDITNKTSHKRTPKFQAALLSFLYQKQGQWVSHKEILGHFKAQSLLTRTATGESARTQLQKALNALDRKLEEYSNRTDARPELRFFKIHRMRGKGVRLTVPFVRRNKPELDWKEIHTLSRLVIPGDVRSLNSVIDIVKYYSYELPHLYDAAWPLLELWEQLGHKVWLYPSSRLVFVERYATLCSSTPNPILKGTLVWGINEFLERGSQAILGYDIAERLLTDEDPITRRVLNVLCKLKPALRTFFVKKGYHLTFESPEDAPVRELADSGARHLESSSKAAKGLEPTTLIYPPEIRSLMDYWHVTRSGQGIGIVTMAELKLILKNVAPIVKGSYPLVQDIYLPILKTVDDEPEFSCFLGIESLEGFRDELPAECARLLAEYLKIVRKPSLAFGIDICLGEIYEEGDFASLTIEPK